MDQVEQELGGEGGIRTLGTGVSPYNGLAITRFHMPDVRNQRLTFGKLHRNLGKMTLFGAICATIVQLASFCAKTSAYVITLYNGQKPSYLASPFYVADPLLKLGTVCSTNSPIHFR
jgi:hypothetical protein